jgi:uncharacterized protein
MRWFSIGVLVTALAVAYAVPGAAVTDCSKPKTKIDWMLCSSDRAVREEQRMARAFRDAANRTEDRRKLLDDQKEWTERVRDACNEIACLLKAYQERVEELESY